MNVRQIQQLAAARTDAHAPGSRTAPKAPPAGQASASADRVEISAEARARAAAERAAEAPELAQARRELLDTPPLDPKRAEEILARVEAGYYSQPQVMRVIAERLTADLHGKAPE